MHRLGRFGRLPLYVLVYFILLWFMAEPLEGYDSTVSNGPLIRIDDLVRIPKETAFVKSSENLQCTVQRCVFGLYKLVGAAPESDVTFMLSDHLAGAVYRVVYKGIDFVHPVAIVGASMQTALTYSAESYEANNPTEAGNSEDSFSGKSSSKILEIRDNDRAVFTSTQAANFRKPGALVKWGVRATNPTVLSDTIISKRIEHVDHGVFDYVVNVTNPDNKFHFSHISAVAVWTPRRACHGMYVLLDGAWKVAVDAKSLYWLNHASLPQAGGLVMCDVSRQTAMGIVLLEYPTGPNWISPRYGTVASTAVWRNWNITQRIGHPDVTTYRVPRGPFGWRIRFFFGTLTDVQARIQRLSTATQDYPSGV
jgi:hypothetical protein